MNGKGDSNRSCSQAYRDGWDRIFAQFQEPPRIRILVPPASLDGVFFGLDSAGNPTTDRDTNSPRTLKEIDSMSSLSKMLSTTSAANALDADTDAAPAPKPEICQIVDDLELHADQLLDQCQNAKDRFSIACRQPEPTPSEPDGAKPTTELGDKLRLVDYKIAAAIDLLADLYNRCEL